MSFGAESDWPIFAPASTRGAALICSPFISFLMPHFPSAFSGLLLSLALAGTAQAQTVTPADTARTYKHHLGLTASPVLDGFFRNNRSLPVGLLYKRQTAPNKLWRFGLVVNQDYSRRDNNNPQPLPLVKPNDEYIYNDWGVSASVGKEFTQRFTNHWTGTMGADASIGFSRYTHEFSQQFAGNISLGTPATEYRQVDRFRYYQAAFTPFIGLRYAIWSILYVSAESALSLTYRRQVIDSKSKSTDLATGLTRFEEGFGPFNLTDQALRFRYRLINQLTLHYMLRGR